MPARTDLCNNGPQINIRFKYKFNRLLIIYKYCHRPMVGSASANILSDARPAAALGPAGKESSSYLYKHININLYLSIP